MARKGNYEFHVALKPHSMTVVVQLRSVHAKLPTDDNQRAQLKAKVQKALLPILTEFVIDFSDTVD